MTVAVELTIAGVVQGVGFRPFIFRLANANGFSGFVQNVGGSAVVVVVEGPGASMEGFVRAIRLQKPSAAYIDSISAKPTGFKGYKGFRILESDSKANSPSMIPADIAVCPDCLREILDKQSRFFRYPFNSCAVCGPRFSVIRRTPYDRANTSMDPFRLCAACEHEYGDPEDIRRFQIQGISCLDCGPRLSLEDNRGHRVEAVDPIREVAKLLAEGMVVGIKGLGGFHLAASASDDEVVGKLRERKRRPSKPFAVMGLDLHVLAQLGMVHGEQAELLGSPERPIVLVDKRKGSSLSPGVAPGLRQIGLFLPYTPLHYLVLQDFRDHFAIMTSGNPPGEPMCIDEHDARRKLASFADYFLVHDRSIANRVDDSVLRLTEGRPAFLRRGRGYAPRWIELPFQLHSPVVCFGAMLQNAGAVGFGDKAVLTQYIGDTDEYFTSLELERYIKLFLENYRIRPSEATAVCDLHPSYPSTTIAERWSRRFHVPLRRVQHHWAHLASVAAEHHHEGDLLGIAIDGTGYGADGNIWGGEVFRFGRRGYARLGQLEYQALPGGDLASVYPARMLAAVLSRSMSDNEIARLFSARGLLRGLPHGREELDVILKESRSASILTSSTGRVLDAASALLGFGLSRSYEGEPAIRLEASSRPGECLLEPRIKPGDIDVLDTDSLFMQLLEQVDHRSAPRLAYGIQNAIGKGLGLIAFSKSRRNDRVLAVSGGAAVNTYLMRGIREGVRDRLQVLTNSRVPPGDGGIALGQALLADPGN